jgi:hypothetical protein
MASQAQKESTKKLDLCKFGIKCRFYPHCHSHHDFTNTPPCNQIVDGKCGFSGICKYAHPKNCIFNKSEVKPADKSEVKPAGKSEGKPAGKSEVKPAAKTEVKPAGKTEVKPAGKTEVKPAGKSEGKPAGKPAGKTEGKDSKKVLGLSDEERMEMRLLELQLKAMRASAKST